MASFPSQAIDIEKTSIRFKEPFLSQALNRKMTGYPLGVYRGFTPVALGTDQLELQLSSKGDSVAVAEDSGFSVHIRETALITLDFTGQLLGDFPLFVVMEVDYTAPPSGSTSAEIKSISPGAFIPDKQVKICEVTKGATIIVAANPRTGERQEPFAFAGATAGFMPGTGFPNGGAVEELEEAANTTIEVQDSRTAEAPTIPVPSLPATFASLKERLDTQLSQAGIAGLLPLIGKQTRGKLFPDQPPLEPGWSGSGTSANVSGDFASVGGVPGTEVEPSTGPTVEGVAVTAPDNWVDCYNLINDEQIDENGNRVHGRLSFNPTDGGVTFNLTDDGDTVAGAFLFTEFSPIVQGTGSDVGTEVLPGDIVEAPDGTFLLIASVDAGLQQLTLTGAYGSTTGRITGPERRRFIVEFQRIIDVASTAVESPLSMPAPPATITPMRFAYHRRYRLDNMPPVSDDADRQRSQAAGRSPNATLVVPGKVLLAPDLGVVASTVPTVLDTRLGAIKVGKPATSGTGTTIGATPGDFKQIVNYIAGANMTITVIQTATGYDISFVAAGGGGGGPSDPVSIPPADGGIGLIGTLGAYATATHQHPVSGAYVAAGSTFVSAAQGNFSAFSGNLVIPTGFTPKAVIAYGLLTVGPNSNFSVGGGVGVGGANQASAHGDNLGVGFSTGKVLTSGHASGTYEITGFDATNVTLTQDGATDFSGGVTVIGQP